MLAASIAKIRTTADFEDGGGRKVKPAEVTLTPPLVTPWDLT